MVTISLIGTVFNRSLNKSIDVYLAASGSGYKRLTESIAQKARDEALSAIKEAVEAGKVFTEENMKNTHKLVLQ